MDTRELEVPKEVLVSLAKVRSVENVRLQQEITALRTEIGILKRDKDFKGCTRAHIEFSIEAFDKDCKNGTKMVGLVTLNGTKAGAHLFRLTIPIFERDGNIWLGSQLGVSEAFKLMIVERFKAFKIRRK